MARTECRLNGARRYGDRNAPDDEGNFIGSRSVEYPEHEQALLDELNARSAAHLRGERGKGFTGIVGTGHVILRDTSGTIFTIGVLELNERDSMSWSAMSTGYKGYYADGFAGSFIQANLKLSRGVLTIAEMKAMLTAPGGFQPDRHVEAGKIVPLAPRTIMGINPDGSLATLHGDRVVKTLMIGRDEEHVTAMFDQLRTRGIFLP